MFFDVHGPFEVPGSDDGGIRAENLKSFWEMIEEGVPGLSGAMGCYIAALKRKGRLKPMYVGKTVRLGFAKECFTPHKQLIFERCLRENRGTLVLFLLPRMTPKGKFCRPASGKVPDIDFLEWYLIGVSLARNPALLNRHDTRMFRDLTVAGILNSGRGKPSSAASALRRTLGLARSKSPRRQGKGDSGLAGLDTDGQDIPGSESREIPILSPGA